ncbi:MAG TPA: alkaline phosphatase family protein [Flavobacteriales bacterium]|nr:alkaline phosphatase family protein [Flavobacteriales bacterium]
MEKKVKKLLIVGWDAADWKIINPLMDAGLMPALEQLVNNGVIGNIATLDPPLSPMLWTSIATGKTADKHGILNFVEPHPEKAEVRPVTSTSRKVKAFWNILNQNGYKCNVVGWWPSNPAEPINGAMVSNLYQKCTTKFGEPWPMSPGTIHPPSLNEIMADMRIHAGELTQAHLLPFLPELQTIASERTKDDHMVENVMGLLSECSTIHNAATWLMENTEWDVMAVYYDAIDVCCHHFMKYHPPQMPGIPDNYFKWYNGVVSSMYRYHDMMLERLLKLAGEDTTVMLLSDHGFHSDHLRPKTLPKEPDAPALEHRSFGILAMKGPGIKKDDRVYGATLLDITPTILDLFGLPVGQDMDGKVLASVYEKEIKPGFIESWEHVDGETGMHPEELQEDPIAAQEALKQLVELGYIESPGADKEEYIRQAIGISNFNLARVLINKRKFEEALPILEKLYREFPKTPRYGFRYASVLHKLRKMEECRHVINSMRVNDKRDQPQLDLLEASLLLSEKKPYKALDHLLKAEKTISHMPSLYLQLGSVYNSISNWEDAIRAYTKALELDHENAAAFSGRGIACLHANKYEEAIEDLLDSTGLVFHNPHAHYFLGEALYKYGEFEKSAEAFKVCISMEPGYRRAYAWLVKIYSEKIVDAEQAKKYKEFMEQHIKGTVTIVSGLPRSGTSMMMQMLAAGGMEILTDSKREKDNNNPKGYYEYDPVKRMATDTSWIAEANGKALKVVTQLLHFLPPKFRYKIIYMKRDMGEIMKSQQVMLGKPTNELNLTIAQVFEKQAEKAHTWLNAQPHIEVLCVDYAETIGSAAETSSKIAAFLDLDLDQEAMAKAVDGSLYRNKSKVSS